jgi:SAM-dependent methyltransferase
MSLLQCSPTIWFAVGFILLFMILERKFVDFILAGLLSVVVLLHVSHFDDQFVWSLYYRIHVEKITKIFDKNTKDYVEFKEPIGYQLTVNSDYHQMLLDLRARSNEHSFLRSWRAVYDYPYRDVENLPQGAILIVGAGTGNDVSAALRNTDRPVFAVEIDPVIMQIGQQLHFEKPYSNPRVTKVVDDARSFFQKTNEKFALVVFGFLDSHTLLSSYSSVRLDNFVYTRESFNQVKQILLPGGKVYVTFASNKVWIHERLIFLLNEIFDYQTVATRDNLGYANGFVYANGKTSQMLRQPDKHNKPDLSANVPRDNWPFLYLRKPTIPKHYIFLICFIMIYGLASLLLLPKGQRRLRLPYFFLGAAFFLIETSNVISLSLLFGSTWYVNIVVFTGILTLVLMGNLTSYLITKPRIKVYFCLLTVCILVAFAVPTYWLLAIDSSFLRGFTASAVFLGPVYFASLIFATLIKEEKNLFQAYGSNVLGAVVGGACEYLSLIFGFKFLAILTLVFYFAAYTMIRKTDTVHY